MEPAESVGGATAERDLVERLKAGDDEAFASFAASYLPALYRFALRRLGNDRNLAQEIAQETVVRVIEGLDSYRGEAELFTWICACCRNEIAGHFRRRSRRPVETTLETDHGDRQELVLPFEAPAGEGPEERLLETEQRELVHLALDRLSSRYAQALEWRYFDELRVDEIAARWDCSYKSAESALSRARAAFFDVYGKLVRELGAAPSSTREEEQA